MPDTLKPDPKSINKNKRGKLHARSIQFSQLIIIFSNYWKTHPVGKFKEKKSLYSYETNSLDE